MQITSPAFKGSTVKTPFGMQAGNALCKPAQPKFGMDSNLLLEEAIILGPPVAMLTGLLGLDISRSRTVRNFKNAYDGLRKDDANVRLAKLEESKKSALLPIKRFALIEVIKLSVDKDIKASFALDLMQAGTRRDRKQAEQVLSYLSGATQ